MTRKWWETPLKMHYTEMLASPPDHPLYRESETYRRELPRLLAEGHEGKSVLIKGDTILGIFADYDEAMNVGRERYLMEPFLVHPILEWQPVFRQYLAKLICPTSPTP